MCPHPFTHSTKLHQILESTQFFCHTLGLFVGRIVSFFFSFLSFHQLYDDHFRRQLQFASDSTLKVYERVSLRPVSDSMVGRARVCVFFLLWSKRKRWSCAAVQHLCELPTLQCVFHFIAMVMAMATMLKMFLFSKIREYRDGLMHRLHAQGVMRVTRFSSHRISMANGDLVVFDTEHE